LFHIANTLEGKKLIWLEVAASNGPSFHVWTTRTRPSTTGNAVDLTYGRNDDREVATVCNGVFLPKVDVCSIG